MKDIYNNTLKDVVLLLEGKIKSLRFYKVCEDDERIFDAMKYLDGKGCFYIFKGFKDDKYGKGIELELINDPETIDYIQEDLECTILFDGITKEEDLFLDKIDKLAVPKFHYYMTRSQLDDIRFDLMKYIVGDLIDIEVFYSDGVVIVRKPIKD